ncbi:membrane protein [Geotalea uraniireducens]|uniref:Membrane protein n=1 Tax=Geotalea uraniireducens TaxID=351604 RepID=A0ABN6VQY6_9BACT|nr:hypothetical protein [Geotalea uraniireducens]BDV41752.1 membrane protein [Geotalea uraniireducens]
MKGTPFTPRWTALLVCLVLTLAVYGNTFRNQWTYDDLPVVVQNPDARSLDSFLRNQVPGRPLRELSYLVDHTLFGDQPAGYRMQQLGWHAANGFLLVLLCQAVGLEFPFALLAGALFLVHPLQAESVANVAHRKELLALFFCLSALLLYLKAVAAERSRRWWGALCSLAAFGCALLANETAVTLPLAVVLAECLFVPRERRLLLRRPLLLAIVAGTVAALLAYHYRGLVSPAQLLTVYSKNNFNATSDYLPLVFGSLTAFGFYLEKIVLPLGLAPEYVFHLSASPWQPWAWLAGGLLVALISAMVLLRRRLPPVAFGIGWFLIFWLPVSNLVPVAYLAADRYMYLCLPGVALAGAALCGQLRKKWASAVAVPLILAWSLLTVIQNGYWRNEHTLWRHAVRVNADSTWVQGAAAQSYLATGELDEARRHARAALALSSYNVGAYQILARVEERCGNLAAALRNYQLFVALGQVDFPDEMAEAELHVRLLKARLKLMKEQR